MATASKILSMLTMVVASLVGSAQAPETLLFRWNWRTAETPQEVLGAANLPEAEKDKLHEAICRVLRDYLPDDTTERRLREKASATRIKIADLTGDGLPEIIAGTADMESGCSPTGNCPF